MALKKTKVKNGNGNDSGIIDVNVLFERDCVAAAVSGKKRSVPTYEHLTVRQSAATGIVTVYFREGTRSKDGDGERLGRIGKHSTQAILNKYNACMANIKKGKPAAEMVASADNLTCQSSFFDVAMRAIDHKEGGTCPQWDSKVGARYAYQLRRTLKTQFKGVHKIPINALEHQDIAQVLSGANTKAPKGNLSNHCRNVFIAAQKYAQFNWKGYVDNLNEIDAPRVDVTYEEHAGFSTQEDVALVDEILETKPRHEGLIWTGARRRAADALRLMMHYGGRGIAIRLMEKEWVDLDKRIVVFPESVMKIPEDLIGTGIYDHPMFLTDTAIEIIKERMEDPTNEGPYVFGGDSRQPLDMRATAHLLSKLYELDLIPLGTFGFRHKEKEVQPHGMKATSVRGMYVSGAGDPATIKLTTNASKMGDAIGSQMHYLPKNHVVTEDKKAKCLIIYEGWIRQGRDLPPRNYNAAEVFSNPETARPHVTFT